MEQSQFYYLGPLLFKSKVEEQTLKQIESLCKKDKSLSAVKDLAGHINDEYKINYRDLDKALESHILTFIKCYQGFYGLLDDFYINNAWVNYMQAGDYNPIHTHTKCDFSAVLFLQMPEEIKKENSQFKGNGGSLEAGPGSLSFTTGVPMKNWRNEVIFLPERGDLFLFPANLMHFVCPFKSNVERITVAFNLSKKNI